VSDRLLLTNSTVITLDPARPHATAIGIRGDRIEWVGDASDADAFTGPRREVDLGGATVVPGFIDAHHHLMTLGHWLAQVNCAYPAVRSSADIVGTTWIGSAPTIRWSSATSAAT
jgi:predicted amidohydrolase YtcJ